MTPADLSRLESLAREATPGPWFRANPNDIGIESENFEIAQTMGLYEREYERMEADAAYIAAANPAAVLALIERVRAAEADSARFRWMARRYDPTDYRRRVDDAIDADMKDAKP